MMFRMSFPVLGMAVNLPWFDAPRHRYSALCLVVLTKNEDKREKFGVRQALGEEFRRPCVRQVRKWLREFTKRKAHGETPSSARLGKPPSAADPVLHSIIHQNRPASNLPGQPIPESGASQLA